MPIVEVTKTKPPRHEMRNFWIVAAVLGVLFVAAFCIGAVMEARTFCKLTGRTDVTWWDAIWVDLRVVE